MQRSNPSCCFGTFGITLAFLGFRDANIATRKIPDKYKGTYKVRITSDKAKSPEKQEILAKILCIRRFET